MTAPNATPRDPSPLPIDEAALVHARKFGLVSEDGEVTCIKGCGRPATLPTLCCRQCLDARRRGWR